MNIRSTRRPLGASWLIWFSISLLAVACGTPQALDQARAFGPPEVVQLKLSLSNVFLIKSAKPVLIDAGSGKDLPALELALTAQGHSLKDIALVVVTHSHGDHAGMARALQRAGAKIVLGRGALDIAASGKHDELKPTGLMARFVKMFADVGFEPYRPDIVVDAALDLHPWGVPGVVRAMPGHTPGSVVVLLDDKRAFAGDMVLGGIMGGQFFADHAGEHYFQADLERNHRNIQTLVDEGYRLLYLGHGGPVSRDSVIRGFNLQPH